MLEVQAGRLGNPNYHETEAFVPPKGAEGNCGAAINTMGHSRPRLLAGPWSEPSVPTPRNARQVPKPRDYVEGLTKGGTRTQLSPQALTLPPRKGAAAFLWRCPQRFRGLPEKPPAARGKVCALRWLAIPGNPPGLALGDSLPCHRLAPQVSAFGGGGGGAGRGPWAGRGLWAGTRLLRWLSHLPFPPVCPSVSWEAGIPDTAGTVDTKQLWLLLLPCVSKIGERSPGAAAARPGPRFSVRRGRPLLPRRSTSPCAHAPVASTGQVDNPCARPSTDSQTAAAETLDAVGFRVFCSIVTPTHTTRGRKALGASASPDLRPCPPAQRLSPQLPRDGAGLQAL